MTILNLSVDLPDEVIEILDRAHQAGHGDMLALCVRQVACKMAERWYDLEQQERRDRIRDMDPEKLAEFLDQHPTVQAQLNRATATFLRDIAEDNDDPEACREIAQSLEDAAVPKLTIVPSDEGGEQ